MLQKTPGLNHIEKLRVIRIIEADFNLMIGILWGKRLLEHSKTWKKLGNLQWGSRKGKSYIDAALLKELTYEVARYTRTDLATFDNDAKSCYDRIVMLYAMLWCQQLGMPPSDANAWEIFSTMPSTI